MAERLKGAFSGFGSELIERIRDDRRKELNDCAFEAEFHAIEKAACALIEAGIESREIKRLLVKYYDLRPSEAEEIYDYQKKYMDESVE